VVTRQLYIDRRRRSVGITLFIYSLADVFVKLVQNRNRIFVVYTHKMLPTTGLH